MIFSCPRQISLVAEVSQLSTFHVRNIESWKQPGDEARYSHVHWVAGGFPYPLCHVHGTTGKPKNLTI